MNKIKKYFFLFLLIFSCSGCANFNAISASAFPTAIDNQWLVNFWQPFILSSEVNFKDANQYIGPDTYIMNSSFAAYQPSSRTIFINKKDFTTIFDFSENEISQDEKNALFTSLMIHEKSHAFIVDNRNREKNHHFEDEYGAYVAQFAWLEKFHPQLLKKILDKHRQSFDDEVIYDWLMFNPHGFAAACWRFYKKSNHQQMLLIYHKSP